MGAEASRLGADRYSPGAILRFIAHIGKMSVGNISDGFRSALDTELERGKALAASAYQMHIGWRETSPEWTDFPWARAPAEGGSAEQARARTCRCQLRSPPARKRATLPAARSCATGWRRSVSSPSRTA